MEVVGSIMTHLSPRSRARNHPPMLLVVAGAVVAVLVLIPLAYLIIRTAGVNPSQFWELLMRPRTLEVLLNSLGLSITVTLLATLIALPLAFLTLRTNLPKRRLWLMLATLPLAIPDYVSSFALIAAFSPKGSLLQRVLEPLGIQELPEIYGWFGAILSITLISYPYLLLSLRAGLQGIDPVLEDAARSLGHSRWSTFWHIIVPQLRPSLVAGGLLVIMYTLQDFGATTLMRFDAFTRVIFIQYRYSFDRHQAAGLSLVLVSIILLILWLEFQARSRAAFYTHQISCDRNLPIVPLGVWKWPAVMFCVTVVSLSLVLPVGVTLFWLVQGWQIGDLSAMVSAPALLTLAGNSMLVAGLAAVAATLCAVPVALLSVRFPSAITTLIERGTYIGFGIPGVVVAIALVFMGANYLPGIYQTLPMLVFAYLLLFLSQSVGTVRAALLQVHPQLEEAARSLGRTSWQTLLAVTLPLIRPGVVSGIALVFLTAIKELPATLLLAPIGFNTLSVQIWKATESISYGDAAAAALVMLIVSMTATLLVLSQSSLKEILRDPVLLREVD